MKTLSQYSRAGRLLLAALLFSAASGAGASALSSDQATSDAAGTGLNNLSVQELLATHEAAVGQVQLDGVLPLPSSYYGTNNPYVLFADTLALSPTAPQTRGSSAVYLYDANNGLPAPGPVPLPAPLLLLASGLGMLAGARRRAATPAAG